MMVALLFCGAMTTMFTSCKSDDENEPVSDKIVKAEFEYTFVVEGINDACSAVNITYTGADGTEVTEVMSGTNLTKNVVRTTIPATGKMSVQLVFKSADAITEDYYKLSVAMILSATGYNAKGGRMASNDNTEYQYINNFNVKEYVKDGHTSMTLNGVSATVNQEDVII